MQLSKEKYERKRIDNGSLLQIENSVTRVTVRHHSASLVMPNSYPRDGIFNQHLTTIKDSYSLLSVSRYDVVSQIGSNTLKITTTKPTQSIEKENLTLKIIFRAVTEI